jgi:glycine/sarcosine N-methyltransferase
MGERLRSTVPSVFDSPRSNKRVYFQVRDWEDDGRSYIVHLFLVSGGEEGWEVPYYQTCYRAVLRTEPKGALEETGFGNVVWHMPARSGYFQPIVTARKQG